MLTANVWALIIDKCKNLCIIAFMRKPKALELHFYQLVSVENLHTRKISWSFSNILTSCFKFDADICPDPVSTAWNGFEIIQYSVLRRQCSDTHRNIKIRLAYCRSPQAKSSVSSVSPSSDGNMKCFDAVAPMICDCEIDKKKKVK